MINSALIFIAFIIYACYALYRYTVYRKFEKQHGCRSLRTVSSRYPFGLDHFFDMRRAIREHRFREYLRLRARKNGPTHQVTLLGQKAIFTSSPENARAIFGEHSADFVIPPLRERSFVDFMGKGIFSVDGPEWQHSRALLRPCFARYNIDDPTLLETSFQRLLASFPADGQSFDLQKLFFRFTMDFSATMLFGVSIDQDAASYDKFVEAFEYCTTYITAWNVVGNLHAIIPDSKYTKSKMVVKDLCDLWLRQALHQDGGSSSKGQSYWFLHELAKETSDFEVLRSELCNILLAARDTTASWMGNLWHALVRRPDILTKLRQEVDSLGGRIPTLKDVEHMSYLRDIMNESLRVHTVVPLNTRTALRSANLPRGGGSDGQAPVHVKPGTTVMVDFYTMNKDPQIWGDDALQFEPSRWRRADVVNHAVNTFTPFSLGKRICLGQKMATMEAAYVTVRLLQTVNQINPKDDEPWQEDFNMIMSSGRGTWVKAERKIVD